MLGDGSGPARQCVVELGLDQNPVGWRPIMPNVLLGGLERDLTSDVGVVLGGFGCSDGLREGFYTALDGDLDAMLC